MTFLVFDKLGNHSKLFPESWGTIFNLVSQILGICFFTLVSQLVTIFKVLVPTSGKSFKNGFPEVGKPIHRNLGFLVATTRNWFSNFW
jgi:hypothetical protein